MAPARPGGLTDTAFAQAVDRAGAWLQAWDSQGTHRTGTDGDIAGAEWLAREATALGAQAAIETFAFDRLDPVETYLEIDGQRIDAVPVFDAPSTNPAGVSGTVGAVGSQAAIAVAELSPRSVYSGDYRALRQSSAHAALVIVTRGDLPGLALLNAEQFRTPYGAPAIHVASDAGDILRAAVERGASAKLVSISQRTRAQAPNVVVRRAGRDASRPPLVVMTPRSSWWQSTAERGGGLVCWLESLRTVLALSPARDVVFTANSGHELGHLGLDDFVARHPGWDGPPPGGATWVHYGANLGAAGGQLSLVSNDDALREAGLAALTEARQTPDLTPPKTLVPSGETRDIHKAGGRYLTLVGSNPWFHMPQDRWPHSVDVHAVARIAAAGARFVAGLAELRS